MNIPEDLRYTSDHEWVRPEDDGVLVVGITDFAQDALGDIVYVQLPDVGRTVALGESCAEIESVKSVSEIYAPLAGEVLATNTQLESTPETVNADPYGAGWLIRMRPSAPSPLEDLLAPDAYATHIGQ